MEQIKEFKGFTLGEVVYLKSDLDLKLPMTVSDFRTKAIYPENDPFALPIRRELAYIEAEWFNSQRKVERANFLPETLKKK
jgi:uncharacterized protein YodC (DUF2158 family)